MIGRLARVTLCLAFLAVACEDDPPAPAPDTSGSDTGGDGAENNLGEDDTTLEDLGGADGAVEDAADTTDTVEDVVDTDVPFHDADVQLPDPPRRYYGNVPTALDHRMSGSQREPHPELCDRAAS